MTPADADGPVSGGEPLLGVLTSPSGLRAEITAHGSVRRLQHEGITLTLYVGNALESGPANLFLRVRGTSRCTPLLGPASPTRFALARGALEGEGQWEGIEYRVALVLAVSAPVWFWHVQLTNSAHASVELDVTYAQDLGLSPYWAARNNEYYVSQYLDHTPLRDGARGLCIASRQNQAADGRNPWCLIGSKRTGAGCATDALQFYGLAQRTGDVPPGVAGDLPSARLQHEHSLAVIRDAPLRLAAAERIETGFFGHYRPDHPSASSEADLEHARAALALPEATAPAKAAAASAIPGRASARAQSGPGEGGSLFARPRLLECAGLDDQALRRLFPGPWRHVERDEGGVLSFFCGEDRHVVLQRKERQVLRPHGHLLRSGRHVAPDELALTSTVWMQGVFHSMLAQGHVSINRLLSTTHSYLGLFRSHGQRVFVRADAHWQLLDVPSAFEMAPDRCRWLYQCEHGLLEVSAVAGAEPQLMTLAIEVKAGEPREFLITHHVALNGDDGCAPGALDWKLEQEQIRLRPARDSELGRRFPAGSFSLAPLTGTRFERIGGDELLFADGRSRGEPYVCVVTALGRSAGVCIRGELIGADAQRPPAPLRTREPLSPVVQVQGTATAGSDSPQARLGEMVPWLAHDAWVHFLSPRGLEQYSGGGWGTRDVCQGPVELLLALGATEPIRELLLRVMRMQNAAGDWPQWFMFFERERSIRAGDAHGDVIFWPLLVLGQYLGACGDAGILEERVPFFDPKGPAAGEAVSVWQHAERALALAAERVIPGPALAAYGHGDWNDSLQPADPALREHMCSAWTVTLHYQTLRTLARALAAHGRSSEAQRLTAQAVCIRADFQRLLMPDGVLAGYAVFESASAVRYLLHPRDDATGVRYSALAMVHAILEDLFTPEQLTAHLALLEGALSGPDGLRLFDKPMPYHGGPQRIFQRAETATFFGREIGLMYVHAHLRYAQALAHLGRADGFMRALLQAVPIGVAEEVPTASVRQANCYFSSSDAAFADRYQASAEYGRVAQGRIALDGGWRVYSSGAGIALGLICRRFLGLSCEAQALCVDPVMPSTLDGLQVATALLGRPLQLQYRVGKAGCGVNTIQLNDDDLSFTRDPNPHRRGAARVSMAALASQLTPARNILRIDLG